MQSHCERCVWGCILVQASGRSWLLRTVLRPRWDLEVPIRSSSCAVQRDCVGLLPFSSLQRAARWPPCVQERVGMTALCVRQGVQGSRQVCAERWKDSSCSCCRGDQETALVLASTQRPLLEGLPAQRHRSASLVEEEPHPERHRSNTSRRPRSAALVTMLHPYGEPQQPVESCPCDALGSPAPCCLGGPRRHTSTAGARSAGMHAPVAAPDAGLQHHPALLRTATDAYYQSHRRQARRLSTAGTAQRTGDVYYQSHAFPRQTNHQQRKPTRPPTTTITATGMPAIAPVLRPPLLTEGSAGLTAGVCVT